MVDVVPMIGDSGEDGRASVMVEYWLASWFGRAWLGLHKGLRPLLGGLPGDCTLVARGEPLAAGRLWLAQDFAVRVWWRFGMVSISLLLPVIGLGAVLPPGRVVTDAGATIMTVLVCVTAIAGAQVGMLRYRSDRNRLYVRGAGPQAADEPLPAGAPGLPRRSDFWVMLIIAVVVFGVLFYASTRTVHN